MSVGQDTVFHTVPKPDDTYLLSHPLTLTVLCMVLLWRAQRCIPVIATIGQCVTHTTPKKTTPFTHQNSTTQVYDREVYTQCCVDPLIGRKFKSSIGTPTMLRWVVRHRRAIAATTILGGVAAYGAYYMYRKKCELDELVETLGLQQLLSGGDTRKAKAQSYEERYACHVYGDALTSTHQP